MIDEKLFQSPTEISLAREELNVRRYEARLGVRKVIYGTLIVGLAGVMVPAAIEGWSLLFQRWEAESRLNAEAQVRNQQFLQTHFETAIDESLELRLRFAEYYAYTVDGYDGKVSKEGGNWGLYYEALKQQRDDLRTAILVKERRRSQILQKLPEGREPEEKLELSSLNTEINWLYDEIEYARAARDDDQFPEASTRPDVDPRSLIGDLRGARNSTMLELIGSPRENYDQTCRPPTNPRISQLMETNDFGPFRATLLEPAARDLALIMKRIQEDLPDLFARLSIAGAQCARLVRGSRSAISNHSWGTAIDLTIDGRLDRRGDGRTMPELRIIAQYFLDQGWFWGAAFYVEDSSHFEVSDQRIRQWAEDGEFEAQGGDAVESSSNNRL